MSRPHITKSKVPSVHQSRNIRNSAAKLIIRFQQLAQLVALGLFAQSLGTPAGEYLRVHSGRLSQQSAGNEPETIGHVEIVDQVVRSFSRFWLDPFVRAESGEGEEGEGRHEKGAEDEYPDVEAQGVEEGEKRRFFYRWDLWC